MSSGIRRQACVLRDLAQNASVIRISYQIIALGQRGFPDAQADWENEELPGRILTRINADKNRSAFAFIRADSRPKLIWARSLFLQNTSFPGA